MLSDKEFASIGKNLFSFKCNDRPFSFVKLKKAKLNSLIPDESIQLNDKSNSSFIKLVRLETPEAMKIAPKDPIELFETLRLNDSSYLSLEIALEEVWSHLLKVI